MTEFSKEIRSLLDETIAGNEDLKPILKKMKAIRSFEKIPGDASTRRYYRVQAETGSFIAMLMEDYSEQGDKLNFLAVQKHLAATQVSVPQVLDSDPKRGFILLEDLGDITLLRRLQEVSSPDTERHLYEQVLDSLVRLQIHASKKKTVELDAFKLRFDHEKLMWEMGFTIEHFYQLHLQRNVSTAALKTMNEGFSEICTILANEPTVLAHRDFHSRNIMVAPGDRLVMIDFQDARMGPAQYDLASLLKDSYYQLEESQIQNLLNYYIARWEAQADRPIDRAHFVHIFDLMALQRNFKAIGSFASFLNRRGNATYLKYIGNTFENIRRTLLKYPQYSSLREVLFHYYYF